MKKLSLWFIIIVLMLLSSCSSMHYQKGDILYDEPTGNPMERSY